MKKSLLLKFVVILMAFIGLQSQVSAQVTTSSLNGTVRDSKAPLPGASIKATHRPTGTVYVVTSNAAGRYSIANMRVGGPYLIEITYVGFQPEKTDDVFLKLGEPFLLNAMLKDESANLQEVVVTGTRNETLNRRRTGAATTISKEQIQNLPTLSRSLTDFTRLTPQSNGSSFAGSNSKFNSLTIDGAVNNDVFGLTTSGLPGGQANTQPISLDAIQEIQVVIAPYDITYGNFTGGGINAVTRSGTNTVEGSVYFFGRNEKLVGKSFVGEKAADFHNIQYGFRIGAPIIKDKLFLFVNAEQSKIEQPTLFNAGDAGAVITQADAAVLTKYVQDEYGYDIGASNGIGAKTESDKIFARLDWNINSKNQLTLRHNYIKAFDDNISRTGSLFRLGNNAYKFNNSQNVSVAELRTQFNSSLSNNLIFGYSRIRDSRETSGSLFPQVEIQNWGGISGKTVQFGSERSSTANELDQDIVEFTNNLKLLTGNHTFTLGTHNEFFKFRNLFVNNYNGRYRYTSLQNFYDEKPNNVDVIYPATAGTLPDASFKAAQLGFYFQDEIQVDSTFRLTAGLRVDVPIFNNKPGNNTAVAASFPGYGTNIVPSGQLLVSPRVGFNWDLTGTRSIQLRGGSGLFTGRAPFVWFSNQYGNTGLDYKSIALSGTTANNAGFEPDPTKQSTVGTAGSTYQVNLMSSQFRIPQTLRTNLAADFKLPAGITATLEGIHSKTINNILYRDLNVKPSVANINPSLTGGADNRPFYGSKVSSTYTGAYLLDNTSKGSSYTLTAELKKNFFNGLFATVAYTYGESKDVNSGASSTAQSNWEFVQVVRDANSPDLVYSNFDIRHRIIASLSYGLNYGKNKASGTNISVFYAGRSGTPFTYLYNGDLNGDGAFSNDLLYVPRTIADIKLVNLTVGTGASAVTYTPAQQWEALNNFISNDPYLKDKRGQYTTRNGGRLPWEHQVDVRLMQDIGGMIGTSKNRLQLSFDIFNFTNLLNKEWGRQFNFSNQAYTLVSYSSSGGGGYTFSPATTQNPYTESFSARWQGQVGVRYLFN
ncbi:MAG TPA: TonB-dependent receptor [Pedobacter sp.]|uniref:TonB-dependent receptor n=1 Tax=Pedobacter sp. TaxID=1411316 RepID=UPI002C8652BE|nr:TonB-dependent receptor [Pedobacter sp.]HMI00953.1 TonB-dependent receptor [Pedobacter sp.]